MQNLKTILVIEDDQKQRDALERYLMQIGYNVVTAFDGLVGLRTAIRIKPNYILMDYVMSNMDGITTLRKLKKHEATKQIPVIMMSADQIDAKGCKFLRKPFVLLDLKNALEFFESVTIQ